jgi:hypothetical protein
MHPTYQKVGQHFPDNLATARSRRVTQVRKQIRSRRDAWILVGGALTRGQGSAVPSDVGTVVLCREAVGISVPSGSVPRPRLWL